VNSCHDDVVIASQHRSEGLLRLFFIIF